MPIAIIIEFIKTYRVQLFISFIFVVWSIGCYNQGKKTVKAQWEKANNEALIKAREVEAKNNEVSNKIGVEYEKGKANIYNDYDTAINELFRSPYGNMPVKTNSSSKSDATSCTNKVYKANARKLIDLAKEAELNTQKLIDLQKWENSIEN